MMMLCLLIHKFVMQINKIKKLLLREFMKQKSYLKTIKNVQRKWNNLYLDQRRKLKLIILNNKIKIENLYNYLILMINFDIYIYLL